MKLCVRGWVVVGGRGGCVCSISISHVPTDQKRNYSVKCSRGCGDGRGGEVRVGCRVCSPSPSPFYYSKS